MVPQTIGTYQILGELGRGAMGVVYQAHDPAIGRSVAIKVIRLDPGAAPEAGAQLRRRLIHEASAAGNLSHPGIVTVHQLGEEGENVFVVMEFVAGPSLERMLGNKTLIDTAQMLDILRQIAEALDYAHKAGVVHRDVKPANILIREDGRVKVADFGIAKLIQDHSMTATTPGTSIGSPAYMSPEQVRALTIDGRSDQFSLGIVAYLMLTGKLPFVGDTAHAVMFQIASLDPLAIQDTCANLPPRVTAALARALAKNPGDRFPICADFVRELSAGYATQSAGSEAATVVMAAVPAKPPAPAANRSVLIAAAAIVLVAVIGGGYWMVRGKHGTASSTASEAPAPAKKEVPLIKAIEEGRMDDAAKLLASGADVNAASENGTTPLMQAAVGSAYLPNNLPAVNMVLAKGAKVDAQDKSGQSALFHAVEEGKDEVVGVLLAHKANPNLKSNDGTTPLHASVTYGKIKLLKILMDAGGDIEMADEHGTTPLMTAAEGTAYMPNNGVYVETLLDKGSKLEVQDSENRTALNRAALEGKLEATKLLLAKKANINVQDKNGATPLLEAVTYGKQQEARLLLDSGADVELADAQGNTPLIVAAEGSAYLPNNAPLVDALLTAHAKVDPQDSHGKTALYRSIAGGKGPAARLLLEHSANPNLADTDGTTPMMLLADGVAEIRAPLELITLMLEHGAKVDLTDGRGRTALGRAEEAKNVKVAEFLKKK